MRFAAAIEAAARRLADDPAAAERQALALMQAAPNDPRAVLILASARRRQGAHEAARALLEPLADAHPRAAQTQYELGLVRAACGETDAAMAALRRAVTLNRDLPEAWRALGDLLFQAGQVRSADQAYAEHLRATVKPPQLKAAAEALGSEDAGRAEALLRAYLATAPHDLAALQMLGETLGRLDRQPEAEGVLTRALTLDATFDGARFTLARVLFEQQKAGEAIGHLHRLLASAPRDAAYRNLMAACLSLAGDLEAVQALYRDLLDDYPRQPRLWLNYAHALRTVGRFQAAVDAYRRCLALAPELGDAYWGLANLKLARFTGAEVAAMQTQLARPDLPTGDRLHMHFALGKALEDGGQDQDAFRSYAAGAAIRRAKTGYSAARTTAALKRTRERLTPALLAAHEGQGDASPDPIFVVGLPRSGSTLVEQILASHPTVEGTMELPDIGLIARSLAPDGEEPLDALARLGPDGVARLGARYLESTRVHRQLGRPFFVDKMPNNFRHIGLIHLILPNARIIDARRHPLGACFSTFKQHFAQGQSFSYDLEDLGLYYRDYVALMASVDHLLPGRVHRVIYEDMVEDTEGEVRRLLAHCNLLFDPACLRFYDNRRAVKTVSSEQVRRPIFREGLEQWRRFEPWLDPLKTALGPALENWRGAARPRPRGAQDQKL